MLEQHRQDLPWLVTEPDSMSVLSQLASRDIDFVTVELKKCHRRCVSKMASGRTTTRCRIPVMREIPSAERVARQEDVNKMVWRRRLQ
jgi:hypothetical protein